jgi:hypothetical protein
MGAPNSEICPCVLREVNTIYAKGDRKRNKIAAANSVTAIVFPVWRKFCKDDLLFIALTS